MGKVLPSGISPRDEIGVKILAWVEAQGHRPPFTIELDKDTTAGHLTMRVREVAALPVDWNLIIGDALFNFRASLDYLAWQLVQFGTKPKPKKPEDVGWPIYSCETKFLNAIDRKLPGLLPKHRTLVEACQPYKAKPGSLHPLAVLNDLSRQDTHRQIVVVVEAMKDYIIRARPRHFVTDRVETPPGKLVLKPGTELVRYFGRRTDDREPEVDMSGAGTTVIAFEDGLWVLDVFAHVQERVGKILGNFEPLF